MTKSKTNNYRRQRNRPAKPVQTQQRNDGLVKLQAFIGRSGHCSRRKAEELILRHKVFVNGREADIGQRINPRTDTVTVDGTTIREQKNEDLVYFLVNKPVGVVSTTVDPEHRQTVLHLLPKQTTRLYPAGRLDQDSQGLMILTNDGDLVNRLTHPRFSHKKTYQVKTDRPMSPAAINHLSKGVMLKDGFCEVDEFEVLDESEHETIFEITIHQGKNRQVRRMLERVGYEAKSLKRTAIGKVSLDLLDDKTYLQVRREDIL